MKNNKVGKIWVIVAALLLSGGVYAQSVEENGLDDGKKVHFMMKANMGAAIDMIMADGIVEPGFAFGLGGVVEFPINTNQRWQVSVGIGLNSLNTLPSMYTGQIGDFLVKPTFNFFMQLPVLFSYTKPMDTRNLFRVEFGPYLSQFLGGCTKGSIVDNVVSHQFNAGLHIGTGFFFGKFYAGTEFDVMCDYGSEIMMSSVKATIGYRF